MPKMKTKKSLAKRIKITKKGKISRKRGNISHLMSKKTKKRKRVLKKDKIVSGRTAKRLRRLLTR